MALRCKWYHIWFHVSCLVHGIVFVSGKLVHIVSAGFGLGRDGT